LKLSESEDLGYIGINETVRKKARTFLVPPFPFVKEDKDKDEKPKATDVIEFFLKKRADSKYSINLNTQGQRFCEFRTLEAKGIIVMLYKRSNITSILLGIC
jgi:hypothetical protein